MNLYQTYRAIIDRLKADTGAGGLYSGSGGTAWLSTLIPGGIWSVQSSPTDMTRPYGVVVMDGDATESHGLTYDAIDINFSITLYDEPRQGIDRLESIWDRIYGNAITQTSRVPSYGLHRHNLTLTSPTLGAVGGDVIWTGGSIGMADEHTSMAVLRFKVTISADATSP